MTREAVDTGLNETETVLGIEVLAVDLQVLTDGDGLLDQVEEILRDGGGKTYGEQACELVFHSCHGVKERKRTGKLKIRWAGARNQGENYFST